jgi:hypothetical protein
MTNRWRRRCVRFKDRRYFQALEGYAGEVLLVRVNYNKSSKDKHHSCKIEKIVLDIP